MCLIHGIHLRADCLLFFSAETMGMVRCYISRCRQQAT